MPELGFSKGITDKDDKSITSSIAYTKIEFVIDFNMEKGFHENFNITVTEDEDEQQRQASPIDVDTDFACKL